jgi:hypothetical protein
MNLWWLRDDEGKRFFKWWEQRYRMPSNSFRQAVRKSYGTYTDTTRASDLRMLRMLKAQYPSGKILRFDSFSVFIAKPANRDRRGSS